MKGESYLFGGVLAYSPRETYASTPACRLSIGVLHMKGCGIMSLLLAGYYKTIFTRLVADNPIPYTSYAPFGQDVFPCQERQAPNGAFHLSEV